MANSQTYNFRNSRPRRHPRTWPALLAALWLGAALTGRAATLTWTGAAGDGRIGTAANWSPAQVPASGDVFIFAGGASLSPQLTTNLTVGSITFNSTAAAFTLGGTAAYTVNSGGITNSSTATETIATAISLGAAQSWNAASGALVFSGPVANGGRRLSITGASSTTISGVLSGTGGLTKTGAGTLTLAGANTFTGTTILSTGTTVIGSGQALGTGVVTLNGGTIQADASSRALANNFTFNLNSTIAGSQNLTLGGVFTQSGTRTLTVNNTAAAIFTGGLRLSSGRTARTLTIAGSGNTVVNSVLSNGTKASTGNLIETGTGTLTLGGSSSNTYVGTVTVNGGTLLLAKTSGLAVTGALTVGDGTGTDTARLLGSEQISDTSAVTVNSGGVFDLNVFNETIASFTGSGAVALGSGTLTVGGGNASWTFAGSLTGAGGLVKNGTGTLTLTGTANSPGSLTANAGTITIGAAGAISSGTVLGASGAGLVSLGTVSATAGGLNLTAGSVQTTTGVLTLAGDATATSSGGTAALVAGKLTLSGTRTFTVTAGGATSDLTISAAVSGSGNLVKAGGGILLLSGANTFTGTTTVNAGTLRLSGGAAIGDATAVSFANASGAVLDLAGTGETVGSLAGGGASGGNVTLGGGTLATGGNNASTTYSGALSGTGGLVKNGSGTFTLAGTNSFTGATAINAGILQLSGGSALSASTAVTLANFAATALDLAGSSAAIGSLAGGGASGGNVTLGSGTLTAGANNTSTSFAGIISGTGGGVNKAGTGTLTLTGANTFTGAIHGTGGTLTLSGAGTATAATSIALDSGSTLTLDNSGTNIASRIGDAVPVSFNGGTLAFISGASGSGETVGALQLAGGNSTVTITHNGTGSNATVLTFGVLGALAPGATVNFNATTGTLGAAATGPQVYITGLASGFIGGWATVGTNFAEYSTFGVRALSGYYTGTDGINVNDPAQLPLLASASPSTAYTLTHLGTTTDKGLNLTDRSFVDLGSLATNTLNLATGGLLKSTSTATSISGTGRLTAGGTAAGSLAVTVDTVSTLTISSAIINNAGANGTYGDGDDGVVALSKGGGGILILSGTNTYTGSNTINSGTLRISAESNLGAVANDVTFNGGTLNVTAGFTANAGKVFTVGAGLSGTLDIASAQTLTLGSTVNDLTSGDTASQLRKAGAGTLLIPVSNTAFTGTLQLDAGTLDLRAANALGGALRINAGSVALRADASTTFAGAVTLAADATIDVARITGSTAVGHSLGALSIGANTLTVTGSNASLTFGAVTLTGAATFAPTTANLTLGAVSGAFGITKSGPGVLTLAGASTYAGATNVTAGTLRVGVTNATSPNSAVITLASGAVLDLNGFSASVASLTGAGNVTLGAGALTAGSDNSSGTFSGVISGAGSFTKTGAGTLTLSGANTSTGATILSGGTITISAAERIADISSVTVAGGATLNLNNFAETIGSLSGAGNVTAGSGALALGGDNASVTFSGILSGTGTLTKTGSGTQTLSGANTYSGATTISAGALNVQNADALGAITAGTTVNSGGELQLQANVAVSAEPLTINGSGVSGSGALRNIADNNSFSGAVTLGSAATIGADAGIVSITGPVSKGANLLTVTGAGTVSLDAAVSGSGTAGLTMNGNGTLILSITNTYAGTTLVNSGTLVVLDAGGLGTTGAGHGTAVASGAALRVEDDLGLAINGELLTLSGTGIGGTGALLSAGGDNSWSGAVTLAANATVGVSADTLDISGIVFESGGARALTKVGTGDLTLSAVNTYTGATLVNEGTLIIGAAGSLAGTSISVAAGAALSVTSGGALPSTAALTADGAVDFNSSTRTLASLSGAATGVLTLNGTTLSTGSGTFAGSIQNGASAGALAKTGAGILVLTGANTFTGATSVAGGTLTAGGAGALGGTASIVVNNSGTLLLGGTGDRLGNATGLTLAGGIFNTGGLSETVGALTLSASSTIDFGSGASVLNFSVAGTTFASGQTLAVSNWSGSSTGGGTDRLIFSQDMAGYLSQISFAGYAEAAQINFGGGQFEVVPVPEPATLLGALGLLGCAGFRERRRLFGWLARCPKIPA